jgi:RND family efflux transporter MFP subunit
MKWRLQRRRARPRNQSLATTNNVNFLKLNQRKVSTMNRPTKSILAAAVLTAVTVATAFQLQAQQSQPPAKAASPAAASPAPTPAAGAQERPRVRTASAETVSGERALRLPARTVPIEEASIFPRATGIVAEQRVDIGDQVKAGQVLAVISAPELANELAGNEANLRSAKAAEQLAQSNRARSEQLSKSGMISQQALTTQITEHDRAVAAREAAEQSMKRSSQMTGFKIVRAPFAGVITARNVQRGDRVVSEQGNGGLPMFHIARMDRLRVQIDVPQAAAPFVKVGTKGEVRFAELPGRVLPAEVSRSAGIIDRSVGAMRVELIVDNSSAKLPAGMSGEVAMRLPAPATATSVPTNAIVTRQGRALVATLDTENTLRFAPVSLGRNMGPRIEVLDGIAAGTPVVLSPNAMLREGDRVDVIQPEKK